MPRSSKELKRGRGDKLARADFHEERRAALRECSGVCADLNFRTSQQAAPLARGCLVSRNCGYKVDGTINGAAGVDTTAGGTATGTSVGAFHAPGAATVEFLCTGNGNTTYDISDITMRIHYLG
jgi:hypothetical protein